jgi:hypothetical protein
MSSSTSMESYAEKRSIVLMMSNIYFFSCSFFHSRSLIFLFFRFPVCVCSAFLCEASWWDGMLKIDQSRGGGRK